MTPPADDDSRVVYPVRELLAEVASSQKRLESKLDRLMSDKANRTDLDSYVRRDVYAAEQAALTSQVSGLRGSVVWLQRLVASSLVSALGSIVVMLILRIKP